MGKVNSNASTRRRTGTEVPAIYCIHSGEKIDGRDKYIDIGAVGEVEVIFFKMLCNCGMRCTDKN
jgi:hypothetical protein